jgi:hypothetical protein
MSPSGHLPRCGLKGTCSLKPFLLEPLLNSVWPPISLKKLASNRLCSSGYLNLFWELLRQQADQILPHPSEEPITISIKPGDLAFLKDL